METALDQVGGHGRFQIRTVFGLGTPCASMSCLWVMSLFWGQKPEHYCVNGTAVLIPCNISNTTNCDYVMETTYVTDFNLLCDNAAIFPAFQASWQVGLIFGEIFWGYLTDRIGRRRSILFSLFSLVTACVSYLISSTLTSYFTTDVNVRWEYCSQIQGCFLISRIILNSEVKIVQQLQSWPVLTLAKQFALKLIMVLYLPRLS